MEVLGVNKKKKKKKKREREKKTFQTYDIILVIWIDFRLIVDFEFGLILEGF